MIKRIQNDRLAEAAATSQGGNKYSSNQFSWAALDTAWSLLGSPRKGQAALSSVKNIRSVENTTTFIASDGVDVSEMGRTCFVVRAQGFASYQPTPSNTR
jgi:hypothetical protein